MILSVCLSLMERQVDGVYHISHEVKCQTPAEKYFGCVFEVVFYVPLKFLALVLSYVVNSCLPPKYTQIPQNVYLQKDAFTVCDVPLVL